MLKKADAKTLFLLVYVVFCAAVLLYGASVTPSIASSRFHSETHFVVFYLAYPLLLGFVAILCAVWE